MADDIYLSVIIPSFNEEKRITSTLKDIAGYLSRQNYKSEIIVVSDGSTDKTAEVVNGLKNKIPNLKLIDNKENHGKGFVTKQGMLEAKGKFRVFTDADNSTAINHVEKMWPEFKKGFDVVIGSREIEGAVLDPPQPPERRKKAAAFRLLTDIFTGLWDIIDSQCGFKCFTEKSVKDIFPLARIDKFSFDVEALVIAKRLGYKIKEVPITWKNDAATTVKFKHMAKMGIDLVKIRINMILGRYNKKIHG